MTLQKETLADFTENVFNTNSSKTTAILKQIVKPMLGFKSFYSASATLSGIELYHDFNRQIPLKLFRQALL